MLLLTQWFDPEPTFKGLLFAKQLRALGYDVRVLTGFPNYPGGKLYDGYRIRLFQQEEIEGIPVLRVPLYPSHDSSGARRALNYLTFALSASVAALLIRRPDVAYVYHPPATVGLPAICLKWFRGVPFVYDVQDLWPDTLGATGMVSQSRVLKAVGSVMKYIYRSATHIVVLSDGFKKTITRRGVPGDKIDVIPNWADEDQLTVAGPSAAARTDGSFTVTFAGNVGRGQALGTLLDAAELMAADRRVRFVIVGGGLEVSTLKAEAQRRQLANVKFLKRRPLSEIGEVLGAADALLVHLKDDPLFEITIPSKTQAYLLAGRPILMGVRGDAARMVQEAGAGVAFSPEDPEDLVKGIETLLDLSPGERQSMGLAGQKYYSEKLSLSVGARRFSEVLDAASLLQPRTLAAKRALDVAVSGLGMAVLAVPFLCVAGVVRIGIGAPVIFKQERPGRDDVPFMLLKFRTMTNARGDNGELLPDKERLTRLGSFLRRSSLDEIPELWNVFRGQMSLVGPRPLLLRYTKHFTAEERIRLKVRPGITGLAQVNGRNTASWDRRLALDVEYVKNLSLGLDVKVLWRTLGKVFSSSGVVVDAESLMLNLDDERAKAIR
ncbi:sugar transferase [Mycetocola zhujimingii]|uniref:sugar transferase n=1 Tax=Mycetocola zhujimingii TaxID=2079792 RepID=UPI001F3DF052|nr:sugar transferase [Mycetocola zhujimingii]